MTITTMSSRDFNQYLSKAKRSSLKGPVFITDRGKAAHVLLSISDYNKIISHKDNIIELLAMKEGDFVELPNIKLADKLFKPATFD